jgi:hypothetical protein
MPFKPCRPSVERSPAPTAIVLLSSLVLGAGISPGQGAERRSWMAEGEMREAFSGQTLDGHYGSGTGWTETYFADGRIDYREGSRAATGKWSYRNASFCTFYDPPYTPSFVGGCWQVLKTGANCYEFYTAGFKWPGRRGEDESAGEEGNDNSPDAQIRWNARGWRTSEPSTCPEKPSV